MYILHAPADEVVTECFKLVLDAGADGKWKLSVLVNIL